jgi:hypothetical protein
MVYVLLDEQSDGYRLPAFPAGFALVLTLEVIVGDDYGSYLMLDYQSSLSQSSGLVGNSGEGFWVLPFESFRADPRHARPSTAGSVRRLYEEFGSTIDAREAMERLAWLLGARDFTVRAIGSATELKNSPRWPDLVKCYKILRYALTIDDEASLHDLADPELLRGHVFLPLDDLDQVLETRVGRRDDREEKWFLGRPLVSNIDQLISTEERRSALRERAIPLGRQHFRRQEEGLLCAVDLGGYGAAHRYAVERMQGFGVRRGDMAQMLRSSVVYHFSQMLSRLGVSQVHMAGDGFIAAFPRRVFDDIDETVARLLERWKAFLVEIEQLNTAIQDPRVAIGSRMALHYGPYQYGRIGLARSFAAAFDGASIIEVARLEQGLALAVKGLAPFASTPDGAATGIDGQRHTLVASDAVNERFRGEFSKLGEELVPLGRVPLDAKEFKAHVLAFRLRV